MGIKPGRCGQISIHAPRTGSDFISFSSHLREGYFNPRSPHGERRRARLNPRLSSPFQSTLPARGATSLGQIGAQGGEISIHAPRTGSDTIENINWAGIGISIHAPRTGSDGQESPFDVHQTIISIHAPRTGSDGCRSCRWTACRPYFNPRSPHGERRPASPLHAPPAPDFNPRSPHGERRFPVPFGARI